MLFNKANNQQRIQRAIKISGRERQPVITNLCTIKLQKHDNLIKANQFIVSKTAKPIKLHAIPNRSKIANKAVQLNKDP